MKRICLIVLILSSFVAAQSTQPSVAYTNLETRANNAFYSGDYAVAMPLLVKLSQLVADQPDRLAPIQEKIRVCQRNLGGSAALKAQLELRRQQPTDIKTAPGERTPHVRPQDGQALTVAIQQLGNFDYDMEKGGTIPDDVKSLDGSKLRTTGYMIPIDQADNITQFALVPSLFACCFGQPPQIQHTIVVYTPKGKAVTYYPDEIVVEGTLRVQEKKEDDVVVSLFEIECTSVKPAPK